MAIYQIQIQNHSFKKALEIEEVKDFILQVERFLVNKNATEEDLYAISDDIIKYQDDVEFDVETLKDVLDKHHIPNKLVLLSDDDDY